MLIVLPCCCYSLFACDLVAESPVGPLRHYRSLGHVSANLSDVYLTNPHITAGENQATSRFASRRLFVSELGDFQISVRIELRKSGFGDIDHYERNIEEEQQRCRKSLWELKAVGVF